MICVICMRKMCVKYVDLYIICGNSIMVCYMFIIRGVSMCCV